MLLYLIWTIQSQTVGRLSLQSLVYEISSLHGPSLRHIRFLEVYLILDNAVPDVLAGLTPIGSFPEHQLVANYS